MRILYVGFKGKNNTSFQLVSKLGGDRVFLTNSFSGLSRDIDGLDEQYDIVILFGIDRRLSSSVRIEKTADLQGSIRNTELPVDGLADSLCKNGIRCAVSETPTHYLCNDAYFRMLKKTNGKAVFIHIPGSKNMTEDMMTGIVRSLGEDSLWDSFQRK